MMMKTMKKLITVISAMILCLSLFIFASCDDSSQSSSETYSTTAYTIVVKYENGTPASGLKVQLCAAACEPDEPTTDANGKVEFTPYQGAMEYTIHVWSAEGSADGTEYEIVGNNKTPTAYGLVNVTVKAK